MSVASRPPGLVIAAPASGSGKTLVTLALLRALRNAGVAVASAKCGPDYIDPAFHAAASGRACINLDPWAMRPQNLGFAAGLAAAGADLLVTEGVMGLFDGASDGSGSTADRAAAFGWPVLLVVDVKGQAASAAAVVRGFARHRPGVNVAGVIFNRVGRGRHEDMLRRAMASELPEIPVLGCLPREEALKVPSRHLGLVQARENPELQSLLEQAAQWVAQAVDLTALQALARRGEGLSDAIDMPLPPLGQRIAVARDDAFAFSYAALLEGWRRQGAEISFFSPLADEAPVAGCDALYLPGGYPELHAGRLAAARRFLSGLKGMAADNLPIFGECGGYMVLGRSLTDGEGCVHAMAGLLPVETSFAAPRLHLGYRRATLLTAIPFGSVGAVFAGHEFHYASVTAGAEEACLFSQCDALGEGQARVGHRQGSVCGSFLHLIDRQP